MSAEGGYDNEDPYLDDKIDDDGGKDDDADYEEEEEVNRTCHFQPGAASTPYHGGEQHEMTRFPSEQSGLPDTSYVETPLFGDFRHKSDRPSLLNKA